MLAIGNSIAAGIGIAGGLSIIRFRTTMRDPRDMVFVLPPLPLASHRAQSVRRSYCGHGYLPYRSPRTRLYRIWGTQTL